MQLKIGSGNDSDCRLFLYPGVLLVSVGELQTQDIIFVKPVALVIMLEKHFF